VQAKGAIFMKTRHGFTLIELLVVIAIIGMLLAVLIPALQYAKMQATGAVCLANMNGMAKAWTLYQEENAGRLVNGHVPRSASYNVLSPWVGGDDDGDRRDNAWWVNPPHDDNGTYTGDPIPCPLQHEENGMRTGKLFPYTESIPIYHCPGDKNYLKQTGRGGKRSYSITGLMNGEDVANEAWIRLYNEIVTPANKYVFVENTDDRGWNMGSWVIFNFGVNRWTDPLAVFHKDRSTLGFADGHAEKHKWVDESTLRMAENQEFNVQVQPPNNNDILYMERGYVPGRWRF